MAASDQWYIAIDPTKTESKEVRSDLRGLDRIEYHSYSELTQKLTVLMEQRYPKRKRGTIDEYLEQQRKAIRDFLRGHPGQTVVTMSQLLQLEVPVLQLAIKPMMETGELVTEGRRKATKYFIKGTEDDWLK